VFDDKRLTVALTVGLDATSLWIGSFKSDNPSMISRGEFDVVGVRRILDLYRRYEILATFLVPGHTALAYPDLICEIHTGGHEIAYHGWVHEDPRDFNRDGQRSVIERGLAALDRVLGERPRGHVSPAWNLSADTIALVREFGFEYDGSRMSHDHYPCYVRQGDRWSRTDPYRFGELTDLVGLPVSWEMDDVPFFAFVWGTMNGLANPLGVEEVWRGDFDYAYANCPGGVMNLTIHPQVSGRGHRMLMLERLIRHMKAREDVAFGRLVDYARWWKSRNSVEDWRAANPELAGTGAIESL
jgi:peptidoglycan/xylan/chitin deacetylase (PgdA/CDA1 family)